MRTYLLLKERAAAFRADPAVQEALSASQVGELATPTLKQAESYLDLIADRSAFEEFDLKTEAAHGFGFAHLDQLAVEHLLGAR
jgi:xylose isomerase